MRIDLQRADPQYAVAARRLSVRLGVPKDRIEDFLQLAYDQLSAETRQDDRIAFYDVVRRAALLVETEYS